MLLPFRRQLECHHACQSGSAEPDHPPERVVRVPRPDVNLAAPLKGRPEGPREAARIGGEEVHVGGGPRDAVGGKGGRPDDRVRNGLTAQGRDDFLQQAHAEGQASRPS